MVVITHSQPGMRTLSLFSGIGGLDLGFERAGFEIVAQCEQNDYCRKVLAKHWPGVPCHKDVKDVGRDTVPERIECVIGGFPCQDISVAGKGAGIHGERSGLWWEMRRVIDELRPAWVCAENVPALRSRGADEVLASLEKLGYSVWPVVVGAVHAGAPHERKRVFVVAHSNEARARVESESGGGPESCDGGAELANTCVKGLAGRRELSSGTGEEVAFPARPGSHQHGWEHPRIVELPMGGAVDGIPVRLVRAANRDALRAYGNAVVPQVAEVIARAILAADKAVRA